MSEFKRQVFPEIHDKPLSELTEAQRDDAREDWIRANCEFVVRDYDGHMAFLLARIDALRENAKALVFLGDDGSAFRVDYVAQYTPVLIADQKGFSLLVLDELRQRLLKGEAVLVKVIEPLV